MRMTIIERRARVLEELRRYRDHWRRRDHRPGELIYLAAAEPSAYRASRLEKLAKALEEISKGGAVQALTEGSEAEERKIYRILGAYRRSGLRGVFDRWLTQVRINYRRFPPTIIELRQIAAVDLEDFEDAEERRREIRDEIRREMKQEEESRRRERALARKRESITKRREACLKSKRMRERLRRQAAAEVVLAEQRAARERRRQRRTQAAVSGSRR